MTYDVLDNERHKAVCKLREFVPMIGNKPTEEASKLIRCITGNDNSHVACGNDLEETRDRLIHLLGGDEPDLQKSPIFEDSGNDDAGEITITDELRKFATDPLLGYASQELHVERITAIADRIDEQFERCCDLWERVAQDAIYSQLKADEECDELQERLDRSRAEYCETCEEAETCDELRAKIKEADAAIANWRERERSFEESEWERDQLRRSLRQISEQAGVPHDRDLSEYGDGQIANAVIGHLGDTNQYVKSLEWVRDRRLPRIEAERDELKAKLDAIREALDGRG